MRLLRFFFVDRFNRFDVAVIVTLTMLYVTGRIGFLGLLGLLFVGFILSAVGDYALAALSLPAASAPAPGAAPSARTEEAGAGMEAGG